MLDIFIQDNMAVIRGKSFAEQEELLDSFSVQTDFYRVRKMTFN